MNQQEIDSINQIATNLNAELRESSRNVPFSDVKEYCFALNQHIQVSLIERRSHEIAANNSHKRTILKMPIPKADLKIEKVSFWDRMFNGNNKIPYKVICQNEKLRDKIVMNTDINDFLKADKHSFKVRTNEQGTKSILELKYTEFILDMEYLLQVEEFMSKIGKIITQLGQTNS